MSKNSKKINIPRLPLFLLKLFADKSHSLSVLGDLEELYGDKIISSSRLNAIWWLWKQVFRSIPHFIQQSLSFGGIMFGNYIKVAIRLFNRQKLYSFINIFGLAIGLTVCLMLYIWVQDELSYDDFHSKADRIFRVEQNYNFDEFSGIAAYTSGAFGPVMKSEYPEIENFVRFWKNELSVKDKNNNYQNNIAYTVDPQIFDVFDFELEEGNPKTALVEPKSVVLTRANALKYTGSESAIGKTITLKWRGEAVEFRVTGILKEVPQNSHVHFDMLYSISTHPADRISSFGGNFLYSYIMLKEGMSVEELKNKLPEFVIKYKEEDFQELIGPDKKIEEMLKIELTPLRNIHLYPSGAFEIEPQGNIASVYTFSSIAILILIIACINFMNLSTARANKRTKEIGMRKAIGAHKIQIMRQMIAESIFTVIISTIISFIFIFLLLPVFNEITGKGLFLSTLLNLNNLLLLSATIIITGALSGLYPAVILTKFNPAIVLKSATSTKTGKSYVRKGMAILQFTISISLIIGSSAHQRN